MNSSQQKILIQIRNQVRQCITQIKKMRTCWEVDGIKGLEHLQNICDFQIKQKSVREIGSELSEFYNLKSPIAEKYQEKINEQLQDLQKSLLKIQSSLEQFQSLFDSLKQQLELNEEFKKFAVFKIVSAQTFLDFLEIVQNQYCLEVENKKVIVKQIEKLIVEGQQMEKDEMQVLIWTWMMQPMINDKEIDSLVQMMQDELN